MVFFADFKTASKDILGKVDREAVLEDAKKDAKSELLALGDRFTRSVSIFFHLIRSIDPQLLDPSCQRGNSGSLSEDSWPSCREAE